MAGIYIHIPFCLKKCNYCDFYSNTNLEIAQKLVESEVEELGFRKDYLRNERIDTIYFGGGTPSVLKIEWVAILLSAVYEYFQVNENCEVTFECNPDDLTTDYLSGLNNIGINRISLGVQSFDDDALKFLGRRHSAAQATDAISKSLQDGFKNISIDLIFGVPGLSFENYKHTLKIAIESGVQHISAYQLTYEEGTLLYKRLINKKIQETGEEESIQQFDYTIEYLNHNGFYQYEVSNYAREGFRSRHNWLYWSNGLYLGIGPSAHSYDGETRQWNIGNNRDYMNGILLKDGYFRIESLTEIDRYNEYVLTSLRTSQGVSGDYVVRTFDISIYKHFIKIISDLVDQEFVNFNSGSYILSKKGIFILDLLVRKLSYS
jgi:oxygen-independent coproporphyrinogen III oxidase